MKKVSLVMLVTAVLTLGYAVVTYGGDDCCEGITSDSYVYHDVDYADLYYASDEAMVIPELEELKAYLVENGLMSLDEIYEILAAGSFLFIPSMARNSIACCMAMQTFRLHRVSNMLAVWFTYCRNCVTIFYVRDIRGACAIDSIDMRNLWLYLYSRRPAS